MAENVFRVTTTAIQYGQQYQNVFHFSGPSSDPNQMSALADEVETFWLDVIKGVVSDDLKWVNISVRLLSSQFATFNKVVSVGGVAGSSNQNFPQVAYIIRLRAAISGKHARGRVFVGGVLSGTLDKGFWRTDIVNSWTDKLEQVVGTWGPSGTSEFRLGIAPKLNSTANWIPMVQMQLAPTSGTQRRRNIGVGV